MQQVLYHHKEREEYQPFLCEICVSLLKKTVMEDPWQPFLSELISIRFCEGFMAVLFQPEMDAVVQDEILVFQDIIAYPF